MMPEEFEQLEKEYEEQQQAPGDAGGDGRAGDGKLDLGSDLMDSNGEFKETVGALVLQVRGPHQGTMSARAGGGGGGRWRLCAPSRHASMTHEGPQTPACPSKEPARPACC